MQTAEPSECHAHPRLFWSESELGNLRAKANHPFMKAFRDEVLARCEHYVDPVHPAFIDNTLNRTDWVGAVPHCGQNWQKLPDLILAAILTDDVRWYNTLASALRILTQDSSPIKAYIFAHAPSTGHDISLLGGPQRNLALQCGMVPLMLDLLWNRLPDADRKAACDFLARDIVDPFLDYMLDPEKDAGFGQNLGINTGWWEFYAWFWSLAVVYDARNERHRRGMDAVIRRIRLGIHLGADEAGVTGEGAGYAAIEMHGWWTAAEILRRMGFCDFWKNDSRFLQIMKTRLYYQLPGPHGILDHGDTDRIGGWYLPSLLVMLLHSRRTGEPAYQASWDRMGGAGDPAVLQSNLHSPLGVLGYWLWYDPSVKPTDVQLDPREWPLAPKAGRFGLHFIRGGWGNDDLYFAFFTAGRFHGSFIHQQNDAGHFALAALGELFCAGRGYGHTPARYHNVLLINGREPPNSSDSANGGSWCGGYTLAATHGRQTHAISADLAWQWHACWYQRHVMVVRMPGSEPYVLIVDHCNNNNDWAFYDWQFQVQPGCQSELNPAETRATVHGVKNRLELAWATYGAGEYSKPQELDLLMDQRRHIYADAPDNHPHHSKKSFDCLIARLTGYCGVLLSALVPRRDTQPPVRIERLHAPRQIGLIVHHGECIDTIVAAPLVRHVAIGGIDAEAGLVVIRRDPVGRLLAASAADCFSLQIDGRWLLPPSGHSETLFEYYE